MDRCDFLIIGAGIVGLTIARALRLYYPDTQICVIDKETELACHASGRNSGVLHAGFYYSADSLKARLTRDGNYAWQNYCDEHQLPVNRCGKLVVAANESEIPGLHELWRRGQANGVRLEWLTVEEARQIEPRLKTYGYALYSPDTVSIDPLETMRHLAAENRMAGIDLKMGTAYQGYSATNDHVLTSEGPIASGYVINAAGLYADQVARDFGFASNYRIIPFKGLYLYAQAEAYQPATHIYPVPDLRLPFLGVHFTTTVTGQTKIGPTAIPALWREHYTGMAGFSVKEMQEIIWQEIVMFLTNRSGFRTLALEEMKKYSRKYLVRCASRMLSGVGNMGFDQWGKPGIRAQLADISRKTLIMDFITEGDKRSYHILNAVSPGFTCALTFAEYVVRDIEKYANSTK